MSRYEDIPHVLEIEEYEGDEGLEREWWIEHPDSCPTVLVHPGIDGYPDVHDHRCCTAAALEAGLDYVWEEWKTVPPGRYVVKGWSTPPGWAGSYPIDAEIGLDVES